MNLKRVFFLVIIFTIMAFSNCKHKGEKPVDQVNDSLIPKEIVELNNKISKEPDNPELYHQRALIYSSKKQFNEALLDVNKSLELSDNKTVYMIALADLYFQMGQPSKTRETLLKTMEKDPKDTEAKLKFAELHLFVRDYKTCGEYINLALAVDPNLAKAYFMRGFLYKENGDTAKAVKSFLTTVDKDPNYYPAYVQLGILYAIKHNPIAKDYYQNAINIQPENPEAYYNLGMFYQEHGKINEAIQTYNSITKFAPQFKYAYFNLGFIHLEYLQIYDKAIEYFDKAIEIDPSYAEAIYNRGLCYEKRGDILNAKKSYKLASDIKPDYPAAIEGMNRVSK